jgi:hypothetical protein
MNQRDAIRGENQRTSDAVRALKSEADICTWVILETQKIVECRALDLHFVIVRTAAAHPDAPSWEVRAVRGWTEWPQPCRRTFLDAVARAQARYDLF